MMCPVLTQERSRSMSGEPIPPFLWRCRSGTVNGSSRLRIRTRAAYLARQTDKQLQKWKAVQAPGETSPVGVYRGLQTEIRTHVSDIVDHQTRSRMMSGIRGKNTKPELSLRRALHSRGFRFRLHSAKVSGRPDLVLPMYRAVVFVHGCFWHRHRSCRYSTTPATRTEFWKAKFASNVARDDAVRTKLLAEGWRVAIVWECVLRKSHSVEVAADLLATWLRSSNTYIEIEKNNSPQSTGCTTSFGKELPI